MPVELPDRYWVQREPQGTWAVLRTHYDDLVALGYGVETDGRREPSAFRGRGNLEQFAIGDRVLVIRRFRRGGMVRFVNRDRFLDPERPFREVVLSIALRELGFHTPQIVAARSQRIGIMGYRLEVITELVEHAQTMGSLLKTAREEGWPRDRWQPQMLAFARLIRALHDSGFLHSDLQPENFLWQAATEKLWVLDLDRSRMVAPGALQLRERAGNLWRLWRYVLRQEGGLDGSSKLLAASDYQRFLKAYEPGREQRRILAQRLRELRLKRARWHRPG